MPNGEGAAHLQGSSHSDLTTHYSEEDCKPHKGFFGGEGVVSIFNVLPQVENKTQFVPDQLCPRARLWVAEFPVCSLSSIGRGKNAQSMLNYFRMFLLETLWQPEGMCKGNRNRTRNSQLLRFYGHQGQTEHSTSL